MVEQHYVHVSHNTMVAIKLADQISIVIQATHFKWPPLVGGARDMINHFSILRKKPVKKPDNITQKI